MRGLSAEIRTDEPLSAHTTFQTGGPAAIYVRGDSAAACEVYRFCREKELPCFLLGRGSNVLVSDAGFTGVVLSLSPDTDGVALSGTQEQTLTANGGASLAAAAHTALSSALSGMEFAAGIPGTVGGGVVMNAGAYGGELRDILTEVRVMTPEGERTVPASALELSYRHSNVTENGWLVLSAEFHLTPGDPAEIRAKMDELSTRRREKQPLEFPSAGSTFKRPEGYFAGKLIEEAGLRGFSIGGAAVSEKHCGFVINRGGATSADIKALIDEIERRVYENSGVRLVPEIRFLGEFA